MSKWPVGKSGNPNGRPKGALNKDTKLVRETIAEIIGDRVVDIPKLLSELPPEKQLHYLIQLMEYALPKLQRTEQINHDFTDLDISLSHLTQEELNALGNIINNTKAVRPEVSS
jgi:DNA-binding transcriptional regulator GbsR (MarR family)